jgi:hypothetical protein
MRVFKEFPENSVCPICKTNKNKECILIGITGTLEGHTMQANPYHLDCVELIEDAKTSKDKTILFQVFDK